MVDDITITYWFFGKFASMKDIRRKYYPMMDLSKFIYIKIILRGVVVEFVANLCPRKNNFVYGQFKIRKITLFMTLFSLHLMIQTWFKTLKTQLKEKLLLLLLLWKVKYYNKWYSTYALKNLNLFGWHQAIQVWNCNYVRDRAPGPLF